MTNIAINGFGRIGRQAFRAAWGRKNIKVVGLNDLTDTKTLAHLLTYDTAYGQWPVPVSYDENNLIVGGKKIPVSAEKDPAMLPWGELKAKVVLECTGRFTKKEDAELHLKAGAKKVIISAPAKGEGAETIVLGVNEDKLESSGEVISNASCTTNCITPVMAVLEEAFGIDKAMMTTIHSYTASQRLQDAPAKDPG